MMKYGAMNSPMASVVKEIVEIADLDFDYVELTLDAPKAHYSLVNDQKDYILKVIGMHSLDLICHLPTFIYTADFTESIRIASVEEAIKSLEVAKALGAQKVVAHPSVVPWLGQYDMETVRRFFYEYLDALMRNAQPDGIAICLENMFPAYGYFFGVDDFEDIFKRFPGLRMTLDIGHANIDCNSGNRALDFIRKFGPRISHVHVSDNMGRADDHLPIGNGTVNFRKIISELKKFGYQGTVTMEIFTDKRRLLRLSRDRFAAMTATV